MELEESMQSFPCLLAKYVGRNNIELTTADELRIFGCFNDGGMINSASNFDSFAFRYSDRKLLTYIAEYIRGKIQRTICGPNGDIFTKEDYSFFKFCNPNAKFPTISTVVGTFYGLEVGSTHKSSTAVLNGKKISIFQNT